MPASPAPHSRPTATTHEVTNQPPPLTGHDVADDPVLIEGVRREGAEWYLDDLHRLGRRAGERGGAALGGRGEPPGAEAAHPRPLRQPHRRGRVPPLVPRPHGRGDQRGPRRCRLGGRAARRARGARGGLHGVEQRGGGPRLPRLDDVRGGPRPASRPGPRQDVRTPADQPCVRVRSAHPRREARAARGHGHDGEAGRHRCARQHDRRRTTDGRNLAVARPQVVHERPDERPLPRARPGPGGSVLLPGPPGPAGRQPQHVPYPAPQGQARQPLQRQQRAGVRRHGGLASRRRGPGRAHHHRHGHHDAPGLRPRFRHAAPVRRSPRRRTTCVTGPCSGRSSSTSP